MVDPHTPGLKPDLPATMGAALLRGLRGKCPRCDGARLFRAWLKPVDRCPYCAQDWSIQQADDFPAYIGIIVTGHLLAPVVIAMIGSYGLADAGDHPAGCRGDAAGDAPACQRRGHRVPVVERHRRIPAGTPIGRT